LETALEELKAAEAQLVESERLAAVGEVAAGIAHEVNNPLNFALNAVRTLRSEVKGLVDLTLVEPGTDPPVALDGMSPERRFEEASASAEVIEELGGIVLEGLERTRSLVQDLKGFASPKKTVWAEMNLVECVGSSLDLVAPTLSEKGIELIRRVDSAECSIVGDAREIAQVVLNLVRNAMEAVVSPGGVIEVALERDDARVEVRVRDDGPGVSEAMLERMFDAFATDKPAGVGTGLGLPVSRRIARNHGGDLTYCRAEEGGALFVFSIPVAECTGSGAR
jgi:two-component system sensor histidine kinase HupT/HoxJ